jgi:hypothetical protein
MVHLSTVATVLPRLVGTAVRVKVRIHPKARCSAPIAGYERLSPVPGPPACPMQCRPRIAGMPRTEADLRVDTRCNHYTTNRPKSGQIGDGSRGRRGCAGEYLDGGSKATGVQNVGADSFAALRKSHLLADVALITRTPLRAPTIRGKCVEHRAVAA